MVSTMAMLNILVLFSTLGLIVAANFDVHGTSFPCHCDTHECGVTGDCSGKCATIPQTDELWQGEACYMKQLSILNKPIDGCYEADIEYTPQDTILTWNITLESAHAVLSEVKIGQYHNKNLTASIGYLSNNERERDFVGEVYADNSASVTIDRRIGRVHLVYSTNTSTYGETICNVTILGYELPRCSKHNHRFYYGYLCKKQCDCVHQCHAVTGLCKCDRLTWGNDCSKACNCEHRCNKFTGRCNQCKPGWWGSNCQRECHCHGGTRCDKEDGACPSRKCHKNYSGKACHIFKEFTSKNKWSHIAVAIAICFILMAVIIFMVCYCCKKQNKSKEKTAILSEKTSYN